MSGFGMGCWDMTGLVSGHFPERISAFTWDTDDLSLVQTRSLADTRNITARSVLFASCSSHGTATLLDRKHWPPQGKQPTSTSSMTFSPLSVHTNHPISSLLVYKKSSTSSLGRCKPRTCSLGTDCLLLETVGRRRIWPLMLL